MLLGRLVSWVGMEEMAYSLQANPSQNRLLSSWNRLLQIKTPDKICMQVKKQQLELDRNNGLVLNWERSKSSLYIVTLLI